MCGLQCLRLFPLAGGVWSAVFGVLLSGGGGECMEYSAVDKAKGSLQLCIY